MFRAVAAILLICWMTVIFCFSSQPAKQSTETSEGFVTAAITVFYPEFDDMPVGTQKSITDEFTFIVRKAAHFSEYFILGILTFLNLIAFKKHGVLRLSVVGSAFCILYAASDEMHQLSVAGRACRFSDVLLDSAGAVTAVILSALVFSLKKKIRNKSGDNNA